ncbi:DUF485 domain-containing protein [Prauserella alba]|uniref:Solute:sodium symporter small subunit n=1 Tax=Prauserella alba TaxID=176898 RepID=A0ABP4G290_9PSEU|nr:DUF485 domain-containing protein [Prauserella alba]MCP2182851.1 Uncharacterized membrane protein, DUF485 family [Prauserella alba]
MPHDDPGVPGAEPAETERNVFDDLVRKRTRLVGKLSALTCLFFFPLPILGQFTDVLDGVVGSGLTWAWIYAFVQFPVALFAAARYSVRARELDRASEQAWKERS